MKRFAFKVFVAAAIYALFLGCGSQSKKGNGEGETPTKLTLYSIDFREAADFQEVLGEIARDDILDDAPRVAKKS